MVITQVGHLMLGIAFGPFGVLGFRFRSQTRVTTCKSSLKITVSMLHSLPSSHRPDAAPLPPPFCNAAVHTAPLMTPGYAKTPNPNPNPNSNPSPYPYPKPNTPSPTQTLTCFPSLSLASYFDSSLAKGPQLEDFACVEF